MVIAEFVITTYHRCRYQKSYTDSKTQIERTDCPHIQRTYMACICCNLIFLWWYCCIALCWYIVSLEAKGSNYLCKWLVPKPFCLSTDDLYGMCRRYCLDCILYVLKVQTNKQTLNKGNLLGFLFEYTLVSRYSELRYSFFPINLRLSNIQYTHTIKYM